MAILRSNSPRRRDLRRGASKPAKFWRRWSYRDDVLWSATFAVALTALGSLIALSAQSRPAYQVDQIVETPIVARVPFRVEDKLHTKDQRETARDLTPAIYSPTGYLKEIRDRIESLIPLLAANTVQSLANIPAETVDKLRLKPQVLQDMQALAPGGKPSPEWKRRVDQFFEGGQAGEGLAGIAALSPDQVQAERNPQQRASKIVLRLSADRQVERYDDQLLRVAVDDVRTTDATGNRLARLDDEDRRVLESKVVHLAEVFPESLRPAVVRFVMEKPRPFYALNSEETAKDRQRAWNSVPAIQQQYQANEVLVPAGTSLSRTDLETIALERQEYHAQLGWEKLLGDAGWVGLIALFAVGLWVYIWAYNPRIVRNSTRGLAITALLVICQFSALVLSTLSPRWALPAAVFPTLVACIILAIAYDRRFALAVGALQSVLVMLTLQLPIGTGIIVLSGVGVAVAQLKDVRTRSKIVVVGLWTGLTMAGVTVLVGLATRPLHLEGQMIRTLADAVLALATGVSTGLLVQGLLPLIEQTFRVTTAMTLKDLHDAAHPLLRRLAQEVPGTYQHSLRLADLAEAAAEAIGANGLLCRVGAMYHDVGKINKPSYFVENQAGGPNRHDKLSPAMSLLVIIGHVKDGMELAREYRLPRDVRHFIESHHGTTLVEYFYHAAKQQRDAQGAPAPSDVEFRYPGPKPQSREAAILMICDAVEGASRTLPEATPSRLEHLVQTMAHKRLMDGQFDDCNLTLRELHKIQQALTKTLFAVHHGRIAYPTTSGLSLTNAPPPPSQGETGHGLESPGAAAN